MTLTGPVSPVVAGLGWVAVALLLIPAPADRRRFTRVFGAPVSRRVPGRWLVRGAAGLGCAVALVLGSGSLIGGVLVVATATVRMRRARLARRHNTECGYLLDALSAVIAELRVGAHPSAAAAVAARETGGIAAQAFAVGAARSRLGGSGADGLLRPHTVIAAELARVADAWRVAERHGLALAELLAAARADLAARIKFRNRTEAALAGARATATILAVLPVLGIGLGQLMGAQPLRVLLFSSIGTFLLPLGAGLACAGLLWADEITRRVVPR
ncbi:type II secretion system F family protein [Nocardia sp. CA-290969]|uniref:type II secretion system F family protein n=1 Tax=Nocardia sp. CA-290969 TaxID=3239986 RepID=UPI003D8DFA65